MGKRYFLIDENVTCHETVSGFSFLEQGGKLIEAIDAFQTALEKNQRNVAAYAGLALSYRGCQFFMESLGCFGMALKYDPENWNILLERCLTHLRLKQYARALDDLNKVIRADYNRIAYHLYWDRFFIILANFLQSGSSTEFLIQDTVALLSLLENIQQDSQLDKEQSLATTFELLLHLYKDNGQAIDSLLAQALTVEPTSERQRCLQFIHQSLENTKIGHVSTKTLTSFMDRLGHRLKELIYTDDTLSITERLEIVSLLIKIRTEDILHIMQKFGIGIEHLPDHTLINLLDFLTPAVSTLFKKCNLSNASTFRKICGICFTRESTEAVRQAFDKNSELIYELEQLDADLRNDLLFQLHQSHYNIISSGHRHIALNFSQALAEVNKILFGSYDPFCRNGEAYLTVDWISAFGHIVFLEILLRLEAAGIGPCLPRKIVSDMGDAANSAVIDFLQSNGFVIVPTSELPNEPRRWQMDYIHSPDGTVTDFMTFMNHAQAQILKKQLPPYLKIPDAWLKNGDCWLKQRGIQTDDHVVVFHCRQSSFWPNLNNVFLNSRNVDAQTYKPSIDYLLNEGSHVFRIGDPGMPVISGLNHPAYCDLTSAKKTKPWLVFYLLYRANLFIGTNSGPAGVVNIFGTPALLSNWFPLHIHIPNLNPENMIIPKLLRRSGRFLALETMMNDPYSSAEHLNEIGTDLYDAHTTDLLAATMEMWRRQKIEVHPDKEIVQLEKSLQVVWRRHMPWPINMPYCFVKKYGAELLQP